MHPGRQTRDEVELEHVPEKSTRFSDKDMLQFFDMQIFPD